MQLLINQILHKMEVFYYEVQESTDLYAKVKELDAVIKDCWKKADAMATKYQANSYLNRQDSYAGGISALCFDKHHILNKKVWEKVEVELKGKKETVYVPRVDIRKEWMKPDEADKLPVSINRILIKKPTNPLVRVITFTGTSKAIQIYRDLLSLPVVPAGTLENMLGLKNSEYQCGYYIDLQHVYIASYEPIEHPDVKPCSDEQVEELEELERISRKEEENETT